MQNFHHSREIQLRPYQEECLASIPDAGAFLICMFTGAGKTVVFSRIPRRGRMLILSHRDELVHQPEKYFDCSFGVEQGPETSHGEEVVSASVQSLVRRLDKFQPNDFDVVVVDECFPAGTLIDNVPIETIKAGDCVTAFNHRTGRTEQRKVLYVFKRKAPPKMEKINGEILCTLWHPIFEVRKGEYKSAVDLRVGDCLLCRVRSRNQCSLKSPKRICSEDREGELFGVQRVDSIEVLECGNLEGCNSLCPDGYVYNLEVEGLNNYFANGILVHNCHHSASPTYRTILNYFKPRLLLGFTATPNRNDGVGLKEIYSDIIYERNLRWGIEHGYLSDIHCLRVDIGVDLRRVAQQLGDYAPDDLDRAINIESANEAIAEAYRLYAKPPVLIFCASVAHAEALAGHIPGAVAVRGGEDRSEVLQAFTEGEIPCLTNCMVFTEGTDIPRVQTVIMARPTKNISLYTQICGRGLRLYPGKEYLTLIDCVGACDEANICTAPSLLGLDISSVPPSQRKTLTGDLFDLPEKIAQVDDRPEVWIKNVKLVDLWARRNNYDLHGVKYFRMPDGSMVLHTPRLKLRLPCEDSLGRIMWQGRPEPAQKVFDAVYEELRTNHDDTRALWDVNLLREWGAAPATEKQCAAVKRYFPDYDTRGMTKYEADQILVRRFGEDYAPATEKQKYFLARRGYDVSKLTKREASKLIRRLKAV